MTLDARQAEATALLRRAVAQGCRPVWAGTRLTDVIGPRLAVIEFTEGMRRLFPDVEAATVVPGAEAPVMAAPPAPIKSLPDPATDAVRQAAKAHRRQIEAWRRGQRKAV